MQYEKSEVPAVKSLYAQAGELKMPYGIQQIKQQHSEVRAPG